jgi:GntR family transcriptional regulator/MocR family aminotransferase
MSTLNLVSRVLFSPGDAVVVESPGYFRVAEAFRAAGARLLPIPVDAQGLVVEALEDLLEQETVRLVHLTAAPQNPTHAVLSPQRRRRLLELAEARDLLLLEGDLNLGFQRELNPSLPLASEDRSGRVVYFSALDQILAPGLQVGFLAGPAPLIKALAKQRQLIDWPGNQMQEATIEELFRDAEVQRHLGRIRKLTAERRETMVDRLLLHLGHVLEVADPREGLSLWARVAPDVPVDAWVERCAARGVTFYPGRIYDFHRRPIPHVCLGFAALDAGEQNEACTRMAAALGEVRGK